MAVLAKVSPEDLKLVFGTLIPGVAYLLQADKTSHIVALHICQVCLHHNRPT